MESVIDMLYIEYTKKCNSKCITCDYWKNKKEDRVVNDEDILKLISKLKDLKIILFTGGEALVYSSDLFRIAKKIKNYYPKIELRLLTNGILVNKYIDDISDCFDTIVYSFDAPNREIYKKIRGIDVFDSVVESIKKVKEKGLYIRLRCMILEYNYLYLDKIIELSNELGVNQISFLPIDLNTEIGFGRSGKVNTISNNINIEKLESIINNILINNPKYVESGLLTLKGENLKNMVKFYKKEICYKYCNAPSSSIVLLMDGTLKNCFFTKELGNIVRDNINDILNSDNFIKQRNKMNKRELKECSNCVL